MKVPVAFSDIAPVRGIRHYYQSFFYRWIDRRVKPATSHILTQQRLYIFPTFRGLVFAGLILLLWLLGTNYQNNMVLALAFFMVSLFIVTILHTYANLSGLRIRFESATSAFAGDDVEFVFSLEGKNATVENLEFRWQSSGYLVKNIDVGKSEKTLVSVPLRSAARGWLTPGRLLVKSEYPLGLLRCGTWLRWRVAALVYPRPLEVPEPPSIAVNEEGEVEHPIRGGEDFSHLTNYRPGDPINHIAWKPFARGKGLFIKEFSQTVSREIWLDFNAVAAADSETKLSGLCYWALEYELRDENYGLRLPGTVIPPGKGHEHKLEVMRALASFDRQPPYPHTTGDPGA